MKKDGGYASVYHFFSPGPWKWQQTNLIMKLMPIFAIKFFQELTVVQQPDSGLDF